MRFNDITPFLLDSFAILSHALDMKISINKTSLTNAPSIRKGILDCVSLNSSAKVKGKSIIV